MNRHPVAKIHASLPQVLAVGVVMMGVFVLPRPGLGQSALPEMEDIAAAYVHNIGRKWKGQRVPSKDEAQRPAGNQMLQSNLLPLAVHADSTIAYQQLSTALTALEHAYWTMSLNGWANPMWDGHRGDTDGFDLYLVDSSLRSDAFIDASAPWTYLDTASTFATVDASLTGVRQEACVLAGYAQAVLLGNNPAEARSWHRATSEWMATDQFGPAGCSDGIDTQQRHHEQSWIPEDPTESDGGALWISMLNARHGGSGIFIRDLWDIAKQRTWEGHNQGLRGSPDLWEALFQLLKTRDTTLHDTVVDFAVVRFFTGPEREDGLLMPGLAGLSSSPSVSFSTDWRALPFHSDSHHPALAPFGSAYAVIDTKGIPANATLKVWLRGEPGVEWSLTASSIRDGKESSRLVAPSRKGVPHSFLPLELLDTPDQVMIAVTNLSSRVPDADVIDENIRSFRLIVDILGDD